MEIYKFTTELTDGRYKGMTVQEVFAKHPDFIFKTLKKWSNNHVTDKTFDDEVLEAANIKKVIKNERFYQEELYVQRDKMAPGKKYRKENKTAEQIIDEIENNNLKIKNSDSEEKYTKKKNKDDEPEIVSLDTLNPDEN